MNTEELSRLLETRIHSFQDRFKEAKSQELSESTLSQLEADWKEVNDTIVVLKFMMTITEDSKVMVERDLEKNDLLEQELAESSIPLMRIVEEFEENIAVDAEEEPAEELNSEPEEISHTQQESAENNTNTEVAIEEVHEAESEDAEEIAQEPEIKDEKVEVVDEESQLEESAESAEDTTNSESVVERNEQLKQEDNSLATRLKKSPITDLKSSIGLNQRFLFSNELFNGNMEAFNRAINEINHMDSIKDASRYIEVQLGPQYHWNFESEVVIEFQELVQRRFM